MTWNSMEEVRAHHRERKVNWFGAGEMKFFKTKVHGGLIGGRYFITSDSPGEEHERRFTLREVEDDGDINSVGAGFWEYRTLFDAQEAAVELMKEDGQ